MVVAVTVTMRIAVVRQHVSEDRISDQLFDKLCIPSISKVVSPVSVSRTRAHEPTPVAQS